MGVAILSMVENLIKFICCVINAVTRWAWLIRSFCHCIATNLSTRSLMITSYCGDQEYSIRFSAGVAIRPEMCANSWNVRIN